MDYLEINNIKKHYDDFNISVDLKIRKGEFFTLLGPSGCGKTTLLRMIAGFIKPDSGNLILNNRDITNIDPKDRNISIVFQNFALFPNRNVYKNISFGPESKKWKSERIRKKVEKLLTVINMNKFSGRKTDTLSGGEKQRVSLARAIAVEPDIILLDEPLSALDVALRNSLRKEIRDIHDSTGLTTIYVTHDQEEAMTLSDRICVMNNGRAEQTGKPEDLYYNPSSLFTAGFLGDSNVIQFDDKIKYGEEKKLENMKGRHLFFRPEHCRVIKSRESAVGSQNLFEGEIIKRSFHGSYYRSEIKCGDNLITVYDYYPFETAGSGRIIFTVEAENIICYS
jgi:ABC-type Fe3+/spermidine/putrescine transport system ATPase subunit